jgi:hypothetical protein
MVLAFRETMLEVPHVPEKVWSYPRFMNGLHQSKLVLGRGSAFPDPAPRLEQAGGVGVPLENYHA